MKCPSYLVAAIFSIKIFQEKPMFICFIFDISVAKSSIEDCSHKPGHRHLVAGEGYLAGTVLQEPALTAALNVACPWKITAQPGQSINISLVNFNATRTAPYSSYGHGSNTAVGSTHRGPCLDVATVMDGDSEESIQLCRHQQRETTVFVSRTHDITVHLPQTSQPHGTGLFLLRYKG